MMIQILLSVLTCTVGVFVLSVLLAAAYTAGVAAGKAAAHVDDDAEDPNICMPHTHGGDPEPK